MICSRCGTEHNDPQKICPKCGLNRPKVRKKWPKWAVWVVSVGGSLLAIGLGIWIFFATVVNRHWLNGIWEGGDVSLEFNESEQTFFLVNGDNILAGTYEQSPDDFTLTTEDGAIYVYRYEREGINTMKLIFTQENETRRVTLTRYREEDVALDPIETE
ncbi:MAG: hypothetical protein IJN80_06065 [Clostridia bacterium]|nr:hypothetical protein [Clostridia bacterium]